MESIDHLFDLAKLIKAKRLERGLTQSELAQEAGVSRRWLVGLEQGDLEDARLSTILKTLKVLGIALLMDEAPVPPNKAKSFPADEIHSAAGQNMKISELTIARFGADSASAVEKLREQNRRAMQRMHGLLNSSDTVGIPSTK